MLLKNFLRKLNIAIILTTFSASIYDTSAAPKQRYTSLEREENTNLSRSMRFRYRPPADIDIGVQCSPSCAISTAVIAICLTVAYTWTAISYIIKQIDNLNPSLMIAVISGMSSPGSNVTNTSSSNATIP